MSRKAPCGRWKFGCPRRSAECHDEASAVNCRLTDLAGKTLRTESISAESGENDYTIDVSSLSSGFYMLEMSTSKGKAVRKVMVQ